MGTFPAVLSGADEAAVNLFLQGRIRLTEIPRLIEGALNSHESTSNPSVEDILAAAKAAREHVLSSVARS
jgi:1-deoxy-D-xylulose-5-phosphate reductoisomerase